MAQARKKSQQAQQEQPQQVQLPEPKVGDKTKDGYVYVGNGIWVRHN